MVDLMRVYGILELGNEEKKRKPDPLGGERERGGKKGKKGKRKEKKEKGRRVEVNIRGDP